MEYLIYPMVLLLGLLWLFEENRLNISKRLASACLVGGAIIVAINSYGEAIDIWVKFGVGIAVAIGVVVYYIKIRKKDKEQHSLGLDSPRLD